MTRSEVVALLSERGVLEVAASVVARYHRGELPLDAAARRLATILRAAREWKAQHGQARSGKLWIKELSADQAMNPLSPMLQLWSSIHRKPGAPSLLPRVPVSVLRVALEFARTPFVRNQNPDAVYDEAVRTNALLDAAHAFHERWVRAFALYDEVARLLDEAA
jgi:hypothetical protein